MRNIVFQILAILLFTISISAQTENPKPILIDEFGRLNAEESFARLDFFKSELSKTANAKAAIRIYGGSENCFLCHYRQGSYTTAILKSRGHSLDKYSIQYCNENEELRIQLYVMPARFMLPTCNQILEIPKKSALFDTIYFYYNNKLAPLENTYVESTSPADGEYSLNGLKAIVKLLSKSPESKIYIVVYLGTNREENYQDTNGKVKRKLDKKSLARKLLLNARREFVKNDINPSRIETIRGGYVDDKRKLEFWFVPKGGEIPRSKPDYFPKKKRQKKK